MTDQQKMSFDASLLKIIVAAGAALITVSAPVLFLV
ncbi:hypothetical protein C8J38_106245 [Rhizobium sp. PP-WC-2G-219]|nr:hypothetical protein C8J32_10229 [Rhizobium sp. PP-CC-3A-592]PYE41476.1 hypothetical protein DFI02_111105 [Rhizobium sp. PP-F2F-G20b]TCL91312.1 hypothetical protein C8J38_106245 [Rhizobium sp. PP-WC-2G-219]